jgi:hypothetical protein
MRKRLRCNDDDDAKRTNLFFSLRARVVNCQQHFSPSHLHCEIEPTPNGGEVFDGGGPPSLPRRTHGGTRAPGSALPDTPLAT